MASTSNLPPATDLKGDLSRKQRSTVAYTYYGRILAATWTFLRGGIEQIMVHLQVKRRWKTA
jgi:hypothetical protein